jgi:hypothetical protein
VVILVIKNKGPAPPGAGPSHRAFAAGIRYCAAPTSVAAVSLSHAS